MHNRLASLQSNWNECELLAPKSARLRAFLAVLLRHPDKPLTAAHPVHKLPQLLAEIRESNMAPMAAIPSQTSYGEALRRLGDPVYLTSHRYRDQVARFSAFQATAHATMFERAVVRRFRRLGVPMFAEVCLFGNVIELVHCTLGRRLSDRQWAVVGHVGQEVAGQLGVDVVWGGDGSPFSPSTWEVL